MKPVMKLTLEIELGNTCMNSAIHIGMALRETENRLQERFGFRTLRPRDAGEGKILDNNGNRVGTWRLE
jgi:hypothetical protein